MSSGARATSAPLARHADVSQVFCAALGERAWRISGGWLVEHVAVIFWPVPSVVGFGATALRIVPGVASRKLAVVPVAGTDPARKAASIIAIGSVSTELAGASA